MNKWVNEEAADEVMVANTAANEVTVANAAENAAASVVMDVSVCVDVVEDLGEANLDLFYRKYHLL